MPEAFDTIVGKVCIERGWVTRDQLVDCLRQCTQSEEHPSSSGSKLSDILVSRGFVRAEQMESLRKEVSRIIASDSDYAIVRRGDASLGQLLVKNGTITKEQLIEAMSVQNYQASKSSTPPRLGEILIEKGFASFAAIEKALLSQKERTPMQCGSCATGYAIVDYDPKKKYLCKKCTGLLLPPQQATADIPEEVKQAAKNPKNVLGKYTVVQELGRGGMGAVYKAWDGPLKRWVALKVLLSTGSKDEVARFRREAQTAAALRHPNIVGIYEVTDIGDKHVIAMEFVDGRSLNGEKLGVLKAAEIIAQVCDAVEYAHSRGIIHRDIKPHNVMIDRQDKAFVMDFGLAKSLEGPSHITVSGTVVGTPSYMSPEQAEGRTSKVGKVSDVYSIGAVLYEILTGRPPFKGTNPVDTLRMVVNEDPKPPSQLNGAVLKDLETIVLKCLEKDPERRYPSAKALAGDLARFSGGGEIRAKRSAFASRVGKRLKRHWAPFVALGAAAVALVLVVLLVASSGSGKENELKVRALLEKAEKQYLDGDYEQALDSFKAVALLDPRHPEAPKRIADCEKKKKAAEEAASRRTEEEKRKAAEAQRRREEARSKAGPEFEQGKLKMDRAQREIYQPGADLARIEQLYDEAVQHFTRAIVLFAEHHEAYHLRGRAQALRSHFAAAEKDFSAALQHLKTFSIAYYDRGRLYIDLALEAMSETRQEGAEAEEEARLWREKAREDLKVYRQFGGVDPEQMELADMLLAVSERDYARAIQICDGLIARHTTSEEVYKIKGDCLWKSGDLKRTRSEQDALYEDAIKAYTEALGKRPTFCEAHLQRGHVQFHMDRIDAALKDLEKAVAPNSRNARAYANRAQIYTEMKKQNEALADLEKAVALTPTDPVILVRIGNAYYARKEYRKALEYQQRAVQLDPKSSNALSQRGAARFATGDTPGALQDFLDAQKLNPANADLNYRIGYAYYTRRDYPRSEEYFTRYIDAKPKSAKARYYRGLSRYNLQKWAEAIADLKEAMVLDPAYREECEPLIAEAQARRNP